MAGSVLKTFGGILLALGIVALLVGLAAAGWGWYGESQNRGPFGVGSDPDRSKANEALLVYGGLGAGAGLLVLLVGIVLLASGAGRANRALVRAVRDGPAGASSGVAAPAAASRKRGALWLGVGVAAALLLAVGLVLAGNVDLGGTTGQRGAGGQPQPAFSTTLHGTVSSGPTVAGGSQLLGDGTPPEPFQVPTEAHRLHIKATWTPGPTCCKTLQLHLERRDGAAWVEVDDHAGAPGFSYNVTLGAPGEYRFRVFPGEDGISAGQEFQVEVVGWP
ncbi:MAG TPA: hypothetical protein VHI93_03880 [Candidatus Thermoplasmatota archaeon]|nr:hypothetical protein [Candidatus Thermoplasmatota archaeon]